jgi:HEAT repeat protein
MALEAYADATGHVAVPALLLALQDDDSWVRERSANYLGKLGDAQVIPALRAAISDPDPDAALAIREALSTLQASAKPQ